MKISKILEAIIAQVTFDTMQSGRNYMLKDQLMLAILRYDGTFAENILREGLDDWQIYQIALRIENALERGNKNEFEIPEMFFQSYLSKIQRDQKTDNLSTLNAVIDILADKNTASSKIFKQYGLLTIGCKMCSIRITTRGKIARDGQYALVLPIASNFDRGSKNRLKSIFT